MLNLGAAIIFPLLPALLLYTSYRSLRGENEYGSFLGILQGFGGISFLFIGADTASQYENVLLLVIIGLLMTIFYIYIPFAYKKACIKFEEWSKDDPNNHKHEFLDAIADWAFIPLMLLVIYFILYAKYYDEAPLEIHSTFIYILASPRIGLTTVILISITIMVYGFIKAKKKYLEKKKNSAETSSASPEK